ncbi:DUF5594 family protein [Cupriavidus sp. KB_39]|jgi:hypothetical protein|uniref:DUF5594 family protein n=1 Tax=Cupriavidus sp. KB_39 TaxID=3233036 RepID=UPI003F8DD9A8
MDNSVHFNPSASAVHLAPAQRFNAEFLPRIIARIHALSRGTLQTEVRPADRPHLPACLRVSGAARAGGGRYAHPLDITLSWDGYEVERLFEIGGETRFAAYLEALPAKLDAWQDARQLDLNTRTQADPAVLIGGLDFEHLVR